MKKRLALCAMVLMLGCDKGQPGETMEPVQQATQAGSGEVAAPTLGTLTFENMQQAIDLVDPFQPWEPAWRQVLALVGEPVFQDGDTFYWYLMHGDMCAELQMQNMNGQVGIVGVTEYSDMMRTRFARCQPGAFAAAETGSGQGSGEGTGQGSR
ncbi:MAG: hypothetical protein JW797_08905 [Bradymonadales bacterium]|nr:hypothetical protein [Bradymonadales bacterium]